MVEEHSFVFLSGLVEEVVVVEHLILFKFLFELGEVVVVAKHSTVYFELEEEVGVVEH